MDDHIETPSRAELAAALVHAVEADPRVLGAVAVFEARNPGFIANVLVDAEALAGVAIDDRSTNEHPSVAQPSVAERSIRAAIRNSGALLSLDTLQVLPSTDITEAFVSLVVAQAKFHTVAAHLERRGFSRTPAPTVRSGVAHL
ncbi:unannotated protein [freshwater metagenome]|uniref:Unannotated protein n=1 Tax=freshwater metagenome TaxID=449393 RepID=A0A6J7EUA4_9ZZZZ|nr:hypothetical protein [Actinomycetota bacterium]